MISPKPLLARSGSCWTRLGSSETREGPSNSEPNTSGPHSNGDLTTTFSSEIAELMSVKSKHGAGGEFTPNWAPKVRWLEFFCFMIGSNVGKHEPPPMPELPPPPPAIEDGGPPQPAKPAWRTVHKRPERRRKQITAATPAPAPAPELASPPVKPETPSWAQWRRT